MTQTCSSALLDIDLTTCISFRFMDTAPPHEMVNHDVKPPRDETSRAKNSTVVLSPGELPCGIVKGSRGLSRFPLTADLPW